MKGVWQVSVFLAIAILLFAGCGGPGADNSVVSGKVTVAGQPMEGITVTFAPTATGRPASGITDSSGNFTLSTFSKGDGAVPGKHMVSFNKAAAALGEAGGKSGGDKMKQPTDPGAASGPAAPFNAKYTKATTSGIEVEVVKGKTNEFTWDLEK